MVGVYGHDAFSLGLTLCVRHAARPHQRFVRALGPWRTECPPRIQIVCESNPPSTRKSVPRDKTCRLRRRQEHRRSISVEESRSAIGVWRGSAGAGGVAAGGFVEQIAGFLFGRKKPGVIELTRTPCFGPFAARNCVEAEDGRLRRGVCDDRLSGCWPTELRC